MQFFETVKKHPKTPVPAARSLTGVRLWAETSEGVHPLGFGLERPLFFGGFLKPSKTIPAAGCCSTWLWGVRFKTHFAFFGGFSVFEEKSSKTEDF